jgi:ferrous iron transport protein A
LRHQNSNSNQSQFQPQRWRFSYFGGTPESRFSENWLEEQGFPLAQARPGQRVQVFKIRNGKIKRLLKKGLVAGDVLTIISIRSSGSVIVAIADQQLGLGAGIAKDLIVTEITASE